MTTYTEPHQGLRYVELDKTSLEILAILAKEPCTSFSILSLQQYLEAPKWKPISRAVERMEKLGYVEYCGIGEGIDAGYNISPELLRSPIRNRLL